MRKLTGTEEEIAAELEKLDTNSIIVLASRSQFGHVDTDIYQGFYGSWVLMDPGDRDDGEHSYRSENIATIAVRRDKRDVYVVFEPTDVPGEDEETAA